MRPDRSDGSPRLIRFRVPGLLETSLAVTLPEVLEVTTLGPVTPVPFTPRFILGLSEWRDRAITVIDLASALRRDGAAPVGSTDGLNGYYMVTQMVVGSDLDVVAWPITPGAATLPAPAEAPQAALPPHLAPALIRAAILLSDQSLVLVKLEGLIPR